jgi:hypothetical protein
MLGIDQLKELHADRVAPQANTAITRFIITIRGTWTYWSSVIPSNITNGVPITQPEVPAAKAARHRTRMVNMELREIELR